MRKVQCALSGSFSLYAMPAADKACFNRSIRSPSIGRKSVHRVVQAQTDEQLLDGFATDHNWMRGNPQSFERAVARMETKL